MILVLPNIKYHLDLTFSLRFVLSDRPYRNFRRPLVRKMKFPGGNAAEGDAFEPLFIRRRKTGAVAGAQQFAVTLGQPPADDRSDRVDDIPAGQIERRRELSLSRRLVMPLLCHKLRAGEAELNAREGVYRIVMHP